MFPPTFIDALYDANQADTHRRDLEIEHARHTSSPLEARARSARQWWRQARRSRAATRRGLASPRWQTLGAAWHGKG